MLGNLSDREKLFLGLLLCMTLVISVMVFMIFGKDAISGQEEEVMPFPFSVEANEQESDSTPLKMIVDIKGGVVRPGVYEMNEGDRVVDGLEKAGGLTEEADLNGVNRALRLVDEMVLYVPLQGEESDELISLSNVERESSTTISLNRSSAEEFESLPGIGPAKANAIVAYREEHGLFRSIEEVVNVSGIGEKSLEKLRPSLRLD